MCVGIQSNCPRSILIWSWEIGIYILIFIPSRRPQANFKPFVFKIFPFLSEIACNDFWLLLVERCNAFYVVCGEVQFSRGCWWIFLMLVVEREPPQFRPWAREAPLVLVPLVPPHNVDAEVRPPGNVLQPIWLGKGITRLNCLFTTVCISNISESVRFTNKSYTFKICCHFKTFLFVT